MKSFGIVVGVIIGIFLLGAVGVGFKYVFAPIEKRIERKVLVESHQYKEGMADRAAVLRAALAEIDARLTMGVDEETRKNLVMQRSVINVQLNAMRR